VPLEERQYDPDSITSYEVGSKIALLENTVYLSSGVYYIDWSDIQTLVPTDLGFVIFGNAGKATARGLELELQTRDLFARGLSLMLGYSYTRVQLEEDIVDLGLSGNRVPQVPRHNGSLSANYEFPLAGPWRAAGVLSTTYTGTSYSRFGPQVPTAVGDLVGDDAYLQQDAYWLTDLSARLSNDNVEVRLFVENVFDEVADLSRALENANSQYRNPYVLRTINQPRTIGVQLTWYVQ
jgi:iron complex outermembrane receptor protein